MTLTIGIRTKVVTRITTKVELDGIYLRVKEVKQIRKWQRKLTKVG